LFLTLSVVDILGLFVVARHTVFPAGQSTNRADIDEVLAESIKTLTGIARLDRRAASNPGPKALPAISYARKRQKIYDK
jgi:hypothetical protein